MSVARNLGKDTQMRRVRSLLITLVVSAFAASAAFAQTAPQPSPAYASALSTPGAIVQLASGQFVCSIPTGVTGWYPQNVPCPRDGQAYPYTTQVPGASSGTVTFDGNGIPTVTAGH